MKDYDFELNELFEKSVGNLLKNEVYDSAAFEIYKRKLENIINESVDEPMVSRQIIRCIQLTKGAVENKIGFVNGATEEVVRQYDQLICALAMNERMTDRKPGKPRLI